MNDTARDAITLHAFVEPLAIAHGFIAQCFPDPSSMDARKRQQNEKKFGQWRELPTGGRLYSYEVQGRSGWRARYVKEVDAEESTVSFYQEVYDGSGNLREVHHKYPLDLGHRQARGDET